MLTTNARAPMMNKSYVTVTCSLEMGHRTGCPHCDAVYDLRMTCARLHDSGKPGQRSSEFSNAELYHEGQISLNALSVIRNQLYRPPSGCASSTASLRADFSSASQIPPATRRFHLLKIDVLSGMCTVSRKNTRYSCECVKVGRLQTTRCWRRHCRGIVHEEIYVRKGSRCRACRRAR
ncbi:hypothetical protein K461DRAFT_66795 [Myriangium duriaei CBS 260.36]|uniref:Uncharacterized protein n=1 Tax=Myriangium duriaei CBS 260.36 TaxID=1168546 RepID=A0A9P4IU86_9PEZI|nr:hypothetical protein K461DRAFT_66795 [Myriangium duriaei CBS 260.36]